MKVHNLVQGSPEWLAYRAQHFNSSDAPAMMGCSPYKTRGQLLREMHTGVAPDVDVATQKRFDNGHRAEALARPLAEEVVGEDLYPVVGSRGKLSASFDGLTLDESTVFEHKALNADIRAAFDAIDKLVGGGDDAPGRLLPIYHRVQMEQQLHVSGAGRALFVASEWTADGSLIEARTVWYLPDDELRGQILAGWAQFERDLAAYAPAESAEPAPVGKTPDTLPALRIEVTGAVTASNLAEFKATALGAIRAVNRTLKTDQDFADAEKAVKWCADVEQRLKAAKEHALSQTADIDALFKALDDIGAEARTVRLDLDKLVARRKTEVKEEAIATARRALDAHIAALNAELAPMRLPAVVADFAGAIKGLKSFASMQDKIDGVLAVAKIAADADARAMRTNLAAFKAAADGFEFLFSDLGQIVHKAADDFAAVVQARIAAHKAEQERKASEKAEADARAAEQRRQAEELAAQRAESVRLEALAVENRARLQAQEAAAAPAPASVVPAVVLAPPRPAIQAAAASPARDEPATLKLSTICERLGVTMTATFLADVLHIQPARTDKAAKLYTERQYALICRQLISHVGAMAELYSEDEVQA